MDLNELNQVGWEAVNQYNPELLKSIQQIIHGTPVDVALSALLVEAEPIEVVMHQPVKPKKNKISSAKALPHKVRSAKDSAIEKLKNRFPRARSSFGDVAKEWT